MQYIGERLRAIRKNRNLTQQKIFERSGISVGTLSDWENNKRAPTTSALQRWADAVGIDFWDIFFSDLTPTAAEINMLTLFRQLTPTDQEHLLSLMKLMSKKK
ncbi:MULTISPECIES: helix-turn-helix domain-containing protein [Paenibacillus]|uniref:HTH cro/C1-type domain-containing protein n=1 Tax=Paenibacillus odorifer TaxID=189426 RepID=A0AB36J364_9BACL|nr:helix-turn-helix transcriptional regulator [Paenibacillus odorifer]OMD07744.1 hypothetical protein BJP50_31500 [Paenibacillus odorifer]OME06174.1 hypothetical protein BSK60_32880 [Paenibacillus odorifer]OME08921.1 hypothetical protein BSK47_32110 [Paenibacillus odorifer]